MAPRTLTSNDKRTFWMLDTLSNPGAVIATWVSGAPSEWRFFKGQPQAAGFPSGATMVFSKDCPKSRKLFDFVANTLRLIVASRMVKDVLDALGVENCEYLPVVIKNHQDEIVGPDYFVIHPFGSEGGIDMERSVYKMTNLDPSAIGGIAKLILRPEGIAPSARFFRLKHLVREYVVDHAVADAFKKAKLTGYRPLAADGWEGSYLKLEE